MGKNDHDDLDILGQKKGELKVKRLTLDASKQTPKAPELFDVEEKKKEKVIIKESYNKPSLKYKEPGPIETVIKQKIAPNAPKTKTVYPSSGKTMAVKTMNTNVDLIEAQLPPRTDKKWEPPIEIKSKQSQPQQYDLGKRDIVFDSEETHEKKYRHELKYYINTHDYYVIRQAISSALPMDENSAAGGYHIRSLYFDDLDNSALFEKINGYMTRHKYRIRIYNEDDSFIRLERKEKMGDLVCKESMRLSKQEYHAILNGDIDFLKEREETLAHDLYAQMRFKLLKPKVVVDYWREAFVGRVEDVRITFDKDIRSGMFDKNMFDSDMMTVPMLEEGTCVLEVKFNRFLPAYLKGLVNIADSASRSAISKYLICRKYD